MLAASGTLDDKNGGTLGEKLGWHWGFGAAGIGMLIGLVVYLAGSAHLHFFAASNLAGFLGGYLEKMPASQFWGMHAAMVGFTGIVVLIVRRFFGHMLHARDEVQS